MCTGVTVRWRPTCCLRYAVILAMVQLGLGNPTEKGFGSSKPRLCWGRAWKFLSLQRAQTSAGGNPPHSCIRAGPKVISCGCKKDKQKAACTEHPEKPLQKWWFRADRLLQDPQLVTLVHTYGVCSSGPLLHNHWVLRHVICKVHVNNWNVIPWPFVFSWDLQGSCRQFSKRVLSESVQRFPRAFWFGSAHLSQCGFCDTQV